MHDCGAIARDSYVITERPLELRFEGGGRSGRVKLEAESNQERKPPGLNISLLPVPAGLVKAERANRGYKFRLWEKTCFPLAPAGPVPDPGEPQQIYRPQPKEFGCFCTLLSGKFIFQSK